MNISDAKIELIKQASAMAISQNANGWPIDMAFVNNYKMLCETAGIPYDAEQLSNSSMIGGLAMSYYHEYTGGQ